MTKKYPFLVPTKLFEKRYYQYQDEPIISKTPPSSEDESSEADNEVSISITPSHTESKEIRVVEIS